jgi:thymidylate synthase
MIAHLCNLDFGDFVHTIGDAHIYLNHLDQVNLQLSRDFKILPTLSFSRKISDINDFNYEDIIIQGYDPHPAIKGEVSI